MQFPYLTLTLTFRKLVPAEDDALTIISALTITDALTMYGCSDHVVRKEISVALHLDLSGVYNSVNEKEKEKLIEA